MSRQFEKKLTFLLYGMKGGENRIKIIEALRERPYNMNQLATKLGLNYRTIKHHVDILVREELLSTAKKGEYGNVFFIAPDLEMNVHIYNKILKKIDRLDYLKDYTIESNFHQQVIHQMNVGVILTDTENNIFFMNGAATGIFGFRETEVLDHHVGPIDKALFKDRKLNNQFKKQGDITDYVKEVADRHDLKKFISLNISRIMGPENRAIGKCFIIQDITEKKKAQDDIRQLQELSQAIFDNIPLGINIKGRDFKVEFQNKMIDTMFGKIKDKKCFEHYWDSKKPCKSCQMIKAYKSGEVHSIIDERSNGRKYLIIQVPFQGDKVLEIMQDITDETLFAQHLLDTHNLYDELMDNISDDMAIVNLKDYTIENANKSFLKKRGGAKNVIGKKCHEVFLGRKTKCKQGGDCPMARIKKKEQSKKIKHTHVGPDGEPYEVLINYYPIAEPSGDPERVIILMLPVSK